MYRMKLWDEDKWDIHSSGYSSSKHGDFSDKKYNEHKYDKEKDISSDYSRKDEETEKEKKKQSDADASEKEDAKEVKEEELPLKAAEQIYSEKKYETKRAEKKKDASTIEDAIKKAIEEEKKVIVMDN